MSSMRQVTDHPEEHLFVTVHHVLELWFKHFIFDLDRVFLKRRLQPVSARLIHFQRPVREQLGQSLAFDRRAARLRRL